MKRKSESKKGNKDCGWQTKLTPFFAPLSFLVSINSAYASGVNAQLPVVTHPASAASIAHSLLVTPVAKTHLTNVSANPSASASSSHRSGYNSGATPRIQSPSKSTLTTDAAVLPTGYQLDLSSATANIVLGSSLFGKQTAVTINVGGNTQTFAPGQKVTGAEYVAIQQQLAANNQTIILNTAGIADGGKLNLNSSVNKNVTEVVIPKGVTALDYFSKNGPISLTGDLLNYGSIYGISTNSHVSAGSISAYEIINENGGIISTVLPGSLSALITNASGSVNLTLNALDNITNAGTISSSGALSLNTTQGSIANRQGALIVADNNVNLNSGNGTLTNTGHISSSAGNINIGAPDSTNLSINAGGGTFNANAGNINVRTSAYNGSSNINLTGGNYLTQNLNLNSGIGTVTGIVGNVTGKLNSQAGVEHFSASGQNLDLGHNTVNGDPTFVSSGNINISGSNTFTESVAILAEGNITAADTGAAIVANGYNVTLIAGATVSTTGTTNSGTTIIPSSANNISGSTGTNNGTGNFTASVDLSTPVGGSIDLSQSTAGNVIDSHSATVAAGSITLVAEANGANGGQIILPQGSNLFAAYNGAGAKANGDVTLIAPNGITSSSIYNGSGPGANNITIVAAQPKSSNGTAIVFNQSGAQTSNNTIEADYSKIGTGSVTGPSTNGNWIASGKITIASGGTVTLPLTSGATVLISAPGSNINIGGNITAPDGLTMIAGGSIQNSGTKALLSTASPSGNAGNMTIIAGATFSQAGNSIDVTGQYSTGGSINLANSAGVTTQPTAKGSFNGGNFNAIAFSGSVDLLGVPLTTGGAGTGTNGNILIIAGGAGASFGNTGGTVNTTGGSGSGGSISIQTATPNATVAAPVVVSTTTSDISNTAANPLNAFGSANFLNTDIVMSSGASFTVHNGAITLMSGGNITLEGITGASGSSLSAAADLALGSGKNLTFDQAVTVNQISGTVQNSSSNNNDITVAGALTAPGGILLVSGGSISNTASLSTANAGIAGNMTLVAGAAFTETASNITVTAQSTAGSISMQGVTLSTKSTGVNTAGGDLNLIAFGGQINAQLGPTIVTGGTGSADNGNFTAVAGGNSGGQLEITSIDTTGGLAGTGNITLLAAIPKTSPNVVISKTTAGVTSGSFLGGTPTNSNVNLDAATAPATLTANGAAITVTTGAGIPNSFTVTDTSSAGTGGSVTLSAVGLINLDQSSISVNGATQNAKGGSITLSFGTLDYLNSTNVPFVFNANGMGTGNGGAISVTATGTIPMAIGTAGRDFEFNAASGASGGNGGNATFVTAGNLSVNTAALILTPHGNGNGDSITLTAGQGNGPGVLSINGPLSANAVGNGSGGSIALQSNSPTSFFISGSAATNGVAGALTASASTAVNEGTISVVNNAGAVVQLLPINTAKSVILTGANAGASGGSGVIVGAQLVSTAGSINLTATTGNITYNTVAEAIYAGSSISLSGGTNGGTVGTAATPLSLDAPTIIIPGSSSMGLANLLNFADGGQFLNTGAITTGGNFTYIGSGNITINGTSHNAFGSAGNISITSALLDGGDIYGNIVLGGSLGSGSGSGAINLTTNGAFGFSSLQAADSAQAATVNLQTGSGAIGATGMPFQVNASNLSLLTTGAVVLNNAGTTAVTLTNAKTIASFTLTSQGQININTSGLNSATSIVIQAAGNNGGVAINNVNVGGTATTGGITLSANGSGLLSETGSGTVIGNGPMSLSAQSGGIFLNINTTGNLTATGTGVVSLGNLNFGTDVVSSGAAGTKWTYGSNGSLILNNIAVSNGYIIALAAGNLLQVNASSMISATNGLITLENANTASGSIVIGSNSIIHTGGTGGAVNIVIGAVPSSPIVGSKPANFQLGTNTGGMIYFGADSIANPASEVTYNLAGSNIVFNTGSRPASAITVGGGSSITADPVGFASAAVVSSPVTILANTDIDKQILVASTSAISGGTFNMHGNVSPNNVANSYQNSPMGASGGELSTVSTLFSNSGSMAAVAGAAVLNAILGDTANISSNTATIMSDASPMPLSSNRQASVQWASDTEVMNGRIPAVFAGDLELGIKQETTLIVDMEEQDGSPTRSDWIAPRQPELPLQGAVSCTAGATRVFALKTGAVVFAPKQNSLVKTRFGAVKIDARSVVLILALRQGLAVFALDATHRNAISVQVGAVKLNLSPGLHALLCANSVNDFADLNPAQLIGQRNLRKVEIGSGLQAYVSEFSIAQALAAVEPLKQLVNSKHPHAQKLAGHLLKTTALLLQTENGCYEQIPRQTLTAYTN